MTNNITKISFQEAGDKGVEISYKVFKDTGQKGTNDHAWTEPPHPDFIKAMEELLPHLLIRTEFMFTSETALSKVQLDPELIKNFRVTGFTISGDDEKEGIIISGYRMLRRSKGGFSFNSLLLRFNNKEYDFMEELNATLAKIRIEAHEYLINDKCGVKAQQELFKKERKRKGEPGPREEEGEQL